MEYKSFEIKLRKDDSDDAESTGESTGEFTGYASVFGNIDSYGDIVEPGAFANELEKLNAGKIPVFYGHDLVDPRNNIGRVVSAEEDETGLLVTCQLDTDGPSNGPIVYKLMQEDRLSTMSFGFSIDDYEYDYESDIRRIKKVTLYEVSVVPIPANSEAVVVDVRNRNTQVNKESYSVYNKVLEALNVD